MQRMSKIFMALILQDKWNLGKFPALVQDRKYTDPDYETWVKVFRSNPEFRILRLTSIESQPQNAELRR